MNAFQCIFQKKSKITSKYQIYTTCSSDHHPQFCGLCTYLPNLQRTKKNLKYRHIGSIVYNENDFVILINECNYLTAVVHLYIRTSELSNEYSNEMMNFIEERRENQRYGIT